MWQGSRKASFVDAHSEQVVVGGWYLCFFNLYPLWAFTIGSFWWDCVTHTHMQRENKIRKQKELLRPF